MRKVKPKIILIAVAIVVFLLGLRACYYGSPFRTCIYTEKEIPLSKKIKESKVLFTRSAVVVTDGAQEDFSCLQEMGSISNEIVSQSSAYIYKKSRPHTVTPSDNLVLQPQKLIAVTKHGISTIDSGPGPIFYLILKDVNGINYQVSTVGLGINKGDEFLKAVSGSEEFLLNPDTNFTE